MANIENIEQLNSLIRRAYNALDKAKVISISPGEIAKTVFQQIDPKGVSSALVQVAAMTYLEQLARTFCRERQIVAEHMAERRGGR